MTQSTLIRPAWTPATIALMVLGFMIFWPLGLAMLAYILWGDRLDTFREDVNRSTDRMAEKFKCGRSAMRPHRSGNTAFDEWREVELSRIDEERRRLDEAFKEFEEYQANLRKARDAEEFDEFMQTRKRKAPPRARKSKDEE